jgi:N4-gp56 family major capsid protein|tara:strand:- start:180 stop:1028 length:849 start_codon:yes stop_codon:yes gene_type:complete
MANETTLSTLDDLIVPMIAEALFVASEASIMRPLVRNYALPKNSGKVIQVPIYPVVAAAAVAEATDLANTAISTSKADLTVAEVGVMTTVTDMAVNTSESDVVKDLGKLFGEGIARKMDADLMALFDGFSGAVGAADAAITVAKIFEAVSKLKQSGVPSNDMACVLHPAVAYDLKANMTNTFANPNPTDVANEALRTGFVGQLAGVNVYESSNMANTGTGGDFKGGLFHKDALGLAMLQDIKIETQRDASIRGTEIVATAVYGVGELHDSYGIEVLADSSIL